MSTFTMSQLSAANAVFLYTKSSGDDVYRCNFTVDGVSFFELRVSKNKNIFTLFHHTNKNFYKDYIFLSSLYDFFSFSNCCIDFHYDGGVDCITVELLA